MYFAIRKAAAAGFSASARALLADLGEVDDEGLDHGEHRHADHGGDRERPAETATERCRRRHSDTTSRMPAPRTVSIATGKPCSFHTWRKVAKGAWACTTCPAITDARAETAPV